jgi:hypothetical protein
VQSLSVTKLVVEAVLAIVARAGIIAGSPLLVSKARLIRERDEAAKEADALRDVVAAFQTGLLVLHHLREEVTEIRAVQIISTRYVVDLMEHIRSGGNADTMPAVPAELRDEVLDAIRRRTYAAPADVAAVATARPT